MQQNWTTENIPDLSGKVMIVTGANSGIGFETAKALAQKGAHIILACRNLELADIAYQHIGSEFPLVSAEVIHLDLANLSTVRDFARKFLDRFDQLDVLINNAGIMMGGYVITIDGFERQFGTNHLGHFALTGLLIKAILQTPAARVVNVSSNGHWFGKMDFNNLMYEGGEGYASARAYGRSKLANLLFTYELQRRFESKEIDAMSVAAHPGVAYTNLTNHIAQKWFSDLSDSLQERWLPSAAMGALPTLRAAVDPDVKGGQYYGPDGLLGQSGYPVLVKSSQASHNREDARRLWEYSIRKTGVSYESL